MRTDLDGQVVAEGLAYRAGFGGGAEAGNLRVVHRVAVLVDDHLRVLGVVDTALAEADLRLLVGEEGIVRAPLVDTDGLGPVVGPGQLGAEAEALQVLLGLKAAPGGAASAQVCFRRSNMVVWVAYARGDADRQAARAGAVDAAREAAARLRTG
ncbi:hypothetical protein ACGFYU_10370 [Streptomyces sp. NPDC048337]|uniref:hypothetical protein n=1 Tax=Streptomyces sp. NPDC048337 TaxID=3365535 RepID=UPI003715225C